MGSCLPMVEAWEANSGEMFNRENLLLERVANTAGSLIKEKVDVR